MLNVIIFFDVKVLLFYEVRGFASILMRFRIEYLSVFTLIYSSLSYLLMGEGGYVGDDIFYSNSSIAITGWSLETV